jgi:hypothetical protein
MAGLNEFGCDVRVSDGVYKSVADFVLDHGAARYKELSEVWRDVERKAQGTVAIAGVFVGGVLALSRNLEVQVDLVRYFSLAGFVALAVSCLCALLALRLKEIILMTSDEIVLSGAKDILTELSDTGAQRKLRAFLGQMAERWATLNRLIERANRRKMRWLRCSHWTLAAGLLSSTLARNDPPSLVRIDPPLT